MSSHYAKRPWTGEEIKAAYADAKSGKPGSLDPKYIESEANYAWWFSEGQEAHAEGLLYTDNPYLSPERRDDLQWFTPDEYYGQVQADLDPADAQAWDAGWHFAERLTADYDRVLLQVPNAWQSIAEQIIDDHWPELIVDRDGGGPGTVFDHVTIEVWSAGLDASDVVLTLLQDPRWTFCPCLPLARMVQA